MAIPNFVELTLDRLKACNDELSTANEPVFRTWSAEALTQYPAYAVTVGGIQGQVSLTPSTETLTIPRLYIISALIAPLTNDINDGAGGSVNYEAASAFPDRFIAYYVPRPRLQTDSEGEPLRYVSEDVVFSDGGIGAREGFGGMRYIAYDFRLIITMSSHWERKY